ncbi:MAG: winged helix-turn-helix transcriptional regulator, partial [Butyrivibrio sp.]|nr:winged helix-turn-helix transcriptional regulator [Butyrivibrio sp.]
MLHIKTLDEGLELFKALGSDVRVEIIKILIKESGMNMNELASRLKITNGALTSHIRKLEECGVVTVSAEASGHGNQKVCSVNLDKILIDIQDAPKDENVYTADIKIGLFTDFEVF